MCKNLSHVLRILYSLLFLTTSVSVCHSQKLGHLAESKMIDEEKELLVEIDFGVGEMQLKSGDKNELYRVDFEYDKDTFRHYFDYKATGRDDRSGKLTIDFKTKSSSSVSLDWDEGIQNRLNLELTNQLPVELDLDLGASKADLDFTDLKVRDLQISTGASKTEVVFDKPNREKLENIEIEAGVAKFTIYGLGNSNFDQFSFEGGLGSFVLDFTGEWQRDGSGKVEIGLGSLDLVFPRDLGVKIIADDTLLTSLDFDFFDKEGDTYYSDNYDYAAHHLTLRIEASIGSIDVDWVR